MLQAKNTKSQTKEKTKSPKLPCVQIILYNIYYSEFYYGDGGKIILWEIYFINELLESKTFEDCNT